MNQSCNIYFLFLIYITRDSNLGYANVLTTTSRDACNTKKFTYQIFLLSHVSPKIPSRRYQTSFIIVSEKNLLMKNQAFMKWSNLKTEVIDNKMLNGHWYSFFKFLFKIHIYFAISLKGNHNFYNKIVYDEAYNFKISECSSYLLVSTRELCTPQLTATSNPVRSRAHNTPVKS